MWFCFTLFVLLYFPGIVIYYTLYPPPFPRVCAPVYAPSSCEPITDSSLPHSGKIVLKNQKAKYQITTPAGVLANTENVVLKVHYNIQPWVGLLTWSWFPESDFGGWKKMKGGMSKAFSFPALKAKKAAA
jgi:hypothetical protein